MSLGLWFYALSRAALCRCMCMPCDVYSGFLRGGGRSACDGVVCRAFAAVRARGCQRRCHGVPTACMCVPSSCVRVCRHGLETWQSYIFFPSKDVKECVKNKYMCENLVYGVFCQRKIDALRFFSLNLQSLYSVVPFVWHLADEAM